MTMALLLVVAACSGASSPAVETTEGATITSRLGFDIPDVDLGRAIVDRDDVHFDTFDGRSVPLSASDRALRERLLDAIPPIDQPEYVSKNDADAWLEPDDVVIGYHGVDQAYAYPTRILNLHELVSDTIDGVPLVVTFCPLCGSGIVFDRRVESPAHDREARSVTLDFSNTSALYENDLVMVDRQTGSYWWQVAGRAIVGQLSDTRLSPLPSETTTWLSWQARNPDTVVLSRNTGFNRSYAAGSFVGYEERLDQGHFPFPVSDAALDPRYPASQRVLAVIIDDEVVGVPLVDSGVARFEAVGRPYVVLVEPPVARAFEDVADGPRRFLDGFRSDDGGRWTVDGEAGDGRMLQPVPTASMFWFAFAAAHPDAPVIEPG